MTRQISKQRTAYSAGGVCYRWVGEIPEVILIATLGGKRWGLPKGQPLANETPAEAAIREIAEETGIKGEVIDDLSSIEYWFRSGTGRIHKLVEFFLLRFCGGTICPQLSEVDDAQWVPLSRALEIISFPRERAILERVYQRWAADQLE